MGRTKGTRDSEDASRLRFACRKVTEKFVRAWIEALEATDETGQPDHDIRIKAANALADRGYGRPAQEVVAQVTVEGETEALEIHDRIAAIVASATRVTDAESTGEPH